MNYCPSCKKEISGSESKCPNCGAIIPEGVYAKSFGTKAIYIVVAVIVAALAVYALFQISEKEKPPTLKTQEAVKVETLKNANGREFSPNNIVEKFNLFMKDAKAVSLDIEYFVLESRESEDIYHDSKNNDSLSLSVTTLKERRAVTSVLVKAQRGAGKPTEFMTYCSALMSIFTPVMKADVRQKVLYNMMGYLESEDMLMADENTYIIASTKYSFTNSGQKGLSLLIEQMPKLEMYSGDTPVLK